MASPQAGLSEAETCEQYILPALRAAGWTDEQIRPQYRINNGRLISTPKRHVQDDPLIADYVLEPIPDLLVGALEAKKYDLPAGNGVEQARRYARKLDLPFAYASNGREIIEIDYRTGTMTTVDAFPSPEELTRRYLADREADTPLGRELLSSSYDHTLRNSDNTVKRPRYYQRNAASRALAAIARGQNRILLVLATGTGKTMVALQLVSKLFKSRWQGDRKPRVLYLSDRTFLVDDPKDQYFEPVFGSDDVHKISGEAKRGRKIYFALYQALEKGDELELFRQYDPDYFDLVIIDECHRGSARDNSQWRRILEYFSPATQVGLTATPISEKEADTFGYFGEPVYEYTLAEGIEDGYLAPYRVRRVRLNVDMEGYKTEPGQVDLNGIEIPEGLYGPREYERLMVILERTEAAAKYIMDYLRTTAEDGRHGKTIIFCVDNDHAHRMRLALFNLAQEETRQHQDYVVRITDADGPHGRALLDEFRKDDSDEPVIAVTSKLLNTGIDLPSVRNIVLFRPIGSMPEFKQTIGRGTRLCPEIGKGSFDIIDFVEATRLFNDPRFDGPPLRVIRDDIDQDGIPLGSGGETPEGEPDEDEERVAEPESEYETEEAGTFGSGGAGDRIDDPDEVDKIRARGKKYVVGDVLVYKWGERRYQLQSDGRTMRLVSIQQYVHDQVLELDLEPQSLRSQWAAARSRRALIEALAKRGIDAESLPDDFESLEVDPVDVLLNAAWGLPLVSREERAHRFRQEHRDFLESFRDEARQVLEEMLLMFKEHGSPHLKADSIMVPPFRSMGTPVEIASWFGDGQTMSDAIDELCRRLLEAA